MQHLGLVLILCFIALAIITFYFGIHIKGRLTYINVLYVVSLIYSIFVSALFISHTSDLQVSLPEAYFNMSIYLLGLIVMQYMGWSRITKLRPWLHLLYLASLTGFPLITYTLSIQRTESIAAFSSTIVFLSLARYCEGKRDILTFILLAIGISGTIMTKPTSAIMCVSMFLIILISTIIKEQSVKSAIPKQFIVSLPIYILAVYFAPHHTLQHSVELLNAELVEHMTITIVAFEILWCVPVLFIFPSVRKFAKSLALHTVAGWMAVCIAFIYQMANGIGIHLVTLHFGLFIAGHYIPFIAVFSFAAVNVSEGLITETGFNPENGEITIKYDLATYGRRLIYNQLIYLIVLSFSFVLFFSNFPFYLLRIS